VTATEFCPQCYRDKPLEEFLSRDGKRFVRQCLPCRERYQNWQALSVAERRARMRAKPRTGIGYVVTFVLRSGNKKTGRIPVSLTDMESCPTSCPMRDHGCYAEFGKLRMHWENVARNGMPWRAFCAAVGELPAETLWRHNEAGDLPGRGDELDLHALRQLVRANARAGARGFTYTHKPLRDPDERRAIAEANAAGFTINLSADNLAHADELADLRIGPVAVVVPSNAPMHASTPAGRAVVRCLAETHDVTCSTCELCWKADRRSVIAFSAHGQAKAIVSDLVTLRKKPQLREVVAS